MASKQKQKAREIRVRNPGDFERMVRWRWDKSGRAQAPVDAWCAAVRFACEWAWLDRPQADASARMGQRALEGLEDLETHPEARRMGWDAALSCALAQDRKDVFESAQRAGQMPGREADLWLEQAAGAGAGACAAYLGAMSKEPEKKRKAGAGHPAFLLLNAGASPEQIREYMEAAGESGAAAGKRWAQEVRRLCAALAANAQEAAAVWKVAPGQGPSEAGWEDCAKRAGRALLGERRDGDVEFLDWFFSQRQSGAEICKLFGGHLLAQWGTDNEDENWARHALRLMGRELPDYAQAVDALCAGRLELDGYAWEFDPAGQEQRQAAAEAALGCLRKQRRKFSGRGDMEQAFSELEKECLGIAAPACGSSKPSSRI